MWHMMLDFGAGVFSGDRRVDDGSRGGRGVAVIGLDAIAE